MIIYFIINKKTQKPLAFRVDSNEDAEYCNSVSAYFEEHYWGNTVWAVSDLKTAEKTLVNNPEWYNASIETPGWPKSLRQEDHEVFPVTIW